MKTTIDIADALLEEAKRIAAAEHTTLRALVEDGLRQTISARRQAERPFRLKDMSVGGQGLQPEFANASWQEILDASYEGRGA